MNERVAQQTFHEWPHLCWNVRGKVEAGAGTARDIRQTGDRQRLGRHLALDVGHTWPTEDIEL
jgi:hypothetical protein